MNTNISLETKITQPSTTKHNLGEMKLINESVMIDVHVMLVEDEVLIIYHDDSFESLRIDVDYDINIYKKPTRLLCLEGKNKYQGKNFKLALLPRHIIEIERYLNKHKETFRRIFEYEKRMKQEEEEKERQRQEENFKREKIKRTAIFKKPNIKRRKTVKTKTRKREKRTRKKTITTREIRENQIRTRKNKKRKRRKKERAIDKKRIRETILFKRKRIKKTSNTK